MKKVNSDTEYVISAKDGRVIEVADFSHDNGAAVQLWAAAGQDSQIWRAVEVAENLYKLENRLSGKVLDVIDAGTNDGAWVHQWDYLGKDNQLWVLEEVRGGVKLRSKLSGKVLDIVALNPDNGARLQIWEDVNGKSQIWTFTAVKEKKTPRKAAEKKEALQKEQNLDQKKAVKAPRKKKDVTPQAAFVNEALVVKPAATLVKTEPKKPEPAKAEPGKVEAAKTVSQPKTSAPAAKKASRKKKA